MTGASSIKAMGGGAARNRDKAGQARNASDHVVGKTG